jgi:hypothetical protein
MASVATIRPDKKSMKIAYKVLKTPKDLQQDNEPHISEKRQQEWYRDTQLSQ